MKRIAVVVLIALAIALGYEAYAQITAARWGGHWPAARMARNWLDSSDDFGGLRPSTSQRNKIINIVLDVDKMLLPLKLEETKKKIELSELLLKPSPAKGSINAKLQEILQVEGKKQQTLLGAYFQVMGVLNPRQQAAFSHIVIRKLTGQGFHHHGLGSGFLNRLGP